jgi:purine nucleosidase
MTVSRVPRERAAQRYGVPISTHPDSLTCACAIDESLILATDDVTVDIDVGGDIARGASAVYPPRMIERWPDRDANARIIRRADTDAFAEMLTSVLR